MTRRGSLLWALASIGSLALPVDAQTPPSGQLLNLFFDCPPPSACGDLDFLRREVPFVNWMRDRADADLHVLVTSQATGGGGRLYTLAFIGLRAFDGESQELTHSTPGDATADEQRTRVVERLRLGLVRYVQGTPAADLLVVTYGDAGPAAAGAPRPPGGPPGSGVPPDDPWDFWSFNVNASTNANGEATAKFSNMSGRISANRITEAWKIELGVNGSRFVQKFEIASGGSTQTIEQTQENRNASSSLVRSVGGRWAIGLRASVSSSTRLNQDLRLSIEPGVEFNFFPYAESSRRSLTLQYLLGPSLFQYREVTIFGKTDETLLQQSLTGSLSLNQPWGRWSTSVTAAQYLHDPERWSVTMGGNLNVRLFRGLSVFANANYQWIRDQLYLSAAGSTTEEVLLRQRQLETSYRYFYNVGIQYRFGSIFNNVVNPRFGGPGGGEVFFF